MSERGSFALGRPDHPAYSWSVLLRDMKRGLSLWAGTRYVCAMTELYGFFDESGIQGGALGAARYCVLAGYVGSPDEHSLFHNGWVEALSRHGLSDFHAKMFFAGRAEPYSSLSTAQRGALLGDLLTVIDFHQITPVGVMVDVAAFQRLSEGERRYVTSAIFVPKRNKWLTSGAPTKPYFAAFWGCLLQAIDLAAPGEKVHFFFDEQNEYASLAQQIFAESRRLFAPADRKKLGGCMFHTAREIPPLQAADLLAHCWCAYGEKEDAMSAERHRALERLTASGAKRIKYLTAEAFEVALSSLPEDERKALRDGERGQLNDL